MKPSCPAFLDTSYLVRYLTNDPPDMAERAASVIDSDEILMLSEMIVLESAYVLASVYKIPRPAIVDALSSLIQRRNLRLTQLSKPLALEALRLCRDSKRNSFVDTFLWALARESGAEAIYAFDRRFPAQGVKIWGAK
ncbi:MAG TPA: PIN domain-containing protein [Thermoanaerobaculia bacterium]